MFHWGSNICLSCIVKPGDKIWSNQHIWKKYLLIVQQLERSGGQKQLVFRNANISPQLAASRAKKNNNTLYIGSANCRIPHATKGPALLARVHHLTSSKIVKYLVQQIHVTNMNYSRFERGDAASFKVASKRFTATSVWSTELLWRFS